MRVPPEPPPTPVVPPLPPVPAIPPWPFPSGTTPSGEETGTSTKPPSSLPGPPPVAWVLPVPAIPPVAEPPDACGSVVVAPPAPKTPPEPEKPPLPEGPPLPPRPPIPLSATLLPLGPSQLAATPQTVRTRTNGNEIKRTTNLLPGSRALSRLSRR
jgi:hypothetical protein